MQTDKTAEYFRSLFQYRDGKLYWKIKKCNKTQVGSEAGSVDGKGYRHVMIDGKWYASHRIIYLMHHNALPQFLDHIDRDKTNNKISNLREATQQQNIWNRGKLSTNTNGCTGAYWSKQKQKWTATIRHNHKKIHLGSFDTIEEAASAYKIAATTLRKNFTGVS